MSSWRAPSYYDFPPFFTLQPVAETRIKQLKLWRELVLGYHEHHRLYSMGPPSTFPLFKNDAIDRKLSTEGIDAVVTSLLSSHEAEWEDPSTRSNLMILWRTPESLAREISQWVAQRLTKFDCIMTVEEIHSDEQSPFLGVEPALVMRALHIMEEEGKCRLMGKEGVKFSV